MNGFNDNGWSLINCEGAEDVVLAVNSTKNFGTTSNPVNSLTYPGGVLCAKASMLLQVCLVSVCSVTLNLWWLFTSRGFVERFERSLSYFLMGYK